MYRLQDRRPRVLPVGSDPIYIDLPSHRTYDFAEGLKGVLSSGKPNSEPRLADRWGSPHEPSSARVFETCRGCESGSGAVVHRGDVAWWLVTSLRSLEQASPGRIDF